jgi:hypothetical protein
MKKTIVTLLFLAVGVLTSACSTLAAIVDAENPPEFAANLAIQYATMRTIEKSKDPATAAAKVAEIARDVKAGLNSADNVPAALLVAGLKSRIPYDRMDARQTLLADALLNLIGKEISRRLDSKTIDADAAVRLSMVADVVIDTAERMR